MPIQDPLAQQIIGFCYRIANTRGSRISENVYENALALELRKAKVAYAQQKSIEVFYMGDRVGTYKADLIVEDRVLVEVKAIQNLSDIDVAQGMNSLRATGLPTCLMITFGKAKIEVRRLGMSPGKGAGGMELEVKDIE